MQFRRTRRKKQLRANNGLKKRLFGHLFCAPCCYCRKVFMLSTLTIEHLVPLTLGGTNEESNIALACHPCNQQKGREAWAIKKQMMKEYYEQYTAQHQTQNEQGFVSRTQSSDLYCEGKSS